MKKLSLLVMPLMAISLLASCNGGGEKSFTLSITLENCKIGEESSTYTKTYVKGATIDAIAVTPTEPCFLNENSISIDYKDYWSEGESGSWILSNLVMNDNYTINIKGLHNYHASVDEAKCDHLSFTTIDDKPLDNVLTTEGEDFTFKMKATIESNGEGYKLPTYLFIYVGDSTVELESDCYIIDPITPQYEATVTILGENVTGDIKISGKGVEQDYYAVDVSKCFGVGTDVDGDSPYFYTNLDGVVTFTQEEGSELPLPAAENIIVKFDDNDWINPSDDSEWCTYDENSHKLTLKADKAVSNVVIAARSPKYQILKELSWKKISDYSIARYAPYLFYVGDTKTVEVNGLDHEVRIIGFNHDVDSSGKTCGITFEFVNTISGFTTCWNNKDGDNSTSYDFINRSNLNDCLQPAIGEKPAGEIYKLMPTDLMSVIKTVNKKVEIHPNDGWIEGNYNTQLFPLSYDEIDGNDDGTYEYYKVDSQNRRKKGNKYWLRSPRTHGSSRAWYCYDTGGLYDIDVYGNAFAVAPAFCI